MECKAAVVALLWAAAGRPLDFGAASSEPRGGLVSVLGRARDVGVRTVVHVVAAAVRAPQRIGIGDARQGGRGGRSPGCGRPEAGARVRGRPGGVRGACGLLHLGEDPARASLPKARLAAARGAAAVEVAAVSSAEGGNGRLGTHARARSAWGG